MPDQRMKQKFEKNVMSVRWTSRNVTKSKLWCCGVDSDYVCPSSLTNRVGLVDGLGASPGSLVLKAGSCFRPDPKESGCAPGQDHNSQNPIGISGDMLAHFVHCPLESRRERMNLILSNEFFTLSQVRPEPQPILELRRIGSRSGNFMSCR